MIRPRVIPCLTLDGDGLYKTTRFAKPRYVGDPVNAVRLFNDKEVDELILVDYTATPQGRGPQFELIAEIAGEAFMPVCYGGGVRTLDDIGRLFRLGVEKVAINSAAHGAPKLIEEAARAFGNQSIVAAIDAKKTLLRGYQAYSHGGSTRRAISPGDWAQQVQDLGAGELLLTSIDRDGTMTGYDLELIRGVVERAAIPVIANGGAGSLADLAAAVTEGGASAAAAGSLFVFHGKHRAVLISYPSPAEIDGLHASASSNAA